VYALRWGDAGPLSIYRFITQPGVLYMAAWLAAINSNPGLM
jgi:hypothetical protein